MSRSARSRENPFLMTTRSAARSWRFSGNVYAGTSQPRIAQPLGDVEDRVRDGRVLQREREHRELAPVGQQLERAHLADRLGRVQRDVTALLLDRAVALEAETQEVVVLRADLVARA